MQPLKASVARRREEAIARTQELARDYAAVFSNPQGKAVLADLVARFYDDRLLDADPLKMAHRVGRRDAVAFIRDMANGGDAAVEATTNE